MENASINGWWLGTRILGNAQLTILGNLHIMPYPEIWLSHTFPGALRSSAGYALAAVGTASPALSPLQPEDLKRLKEQQTSTVSPQATGAGDLDGSPILFFVQYVHIYTYDSMI